jgi:phosphate transport system substrate-binding protein
MIASVMVASVSLLACGASAETLKVGGSVGTEAILQQLGTAFAAQTGIAVKVVPGLASRGGLRALADGAIDLASAGRPPNADEIGKGLAIALSVKTPFVLVTSNRDPGGLRSTEVADLIAAPHAKWADGTPVNVILRQKAATETALMAEFFPGSAAAMELARQRADVPVASDDGNNANLAEQMPGSFVPATYLQVVTEKRRLQMIPIDGVAPTLENLDSGKYRFTQKLYLIIRRPPSVSTERFVTYLRSAEAQHIMRSAGLIPNGSE